MLCNIKYRSELVWSVGLVASLAFFMVLVSCGDDKGTGREVVVRPSPKRAQMKTVPPPEAETTPVSDKTMQPQRSISEPEPPREVTYEEAEAAYRERNYSKAVEFITQYTERKKENPWGFYMLGLSAWKAGDPETAEEAFERALELDPDHVKSQLNLSRVLLDTGRPEEALDRIDKALENDSESNVAYRLRGRALHQLGQPLEAIDAYRQAIQIDDRDAWSMNNMGLIFVEKGRFDDALLPLARAVELRDDVAIFRNNLGMALEHTGHFRAAEEAYKSAIAIDASHDKASANLARVMVLVENSGLEPLDLGALAQSFKDEIEVWRAASASSEEPDSVKQDKIIVSEADSTENSQEQ